MRGSRAPAKRTQQSNTQQRFATLSRGRRSKLAKAAGTTLLKADQWARGGATDAAIATALETHLDKLRAVTPAAK
jgi:hypothetical protein